MKKKYSILLFLFSLVATPLVAQVESNFSKKYIARLETLFEEGRKCYVGIGNKYQLKRVIDAYEVALSQARTDGIITLEDENNLMLQVKLDKLWGDYHYLNSDEDSHSYVQAEKHFKDALAIAEASDIGQESYYYRFVIHEELAQLYYKQGRYVEANMEMECAFEYSNYLYNLPDSDNAILDFISQQAMCKARVSRFSEAINDINAVISNYRNTDSERYGEALRKKAKILMLQQESGDTGMADPTEDALKCYKEFFSLKKEDALLHFEAMSSEEREQYWMRIRPFVVDCYRLENADPAFLYDVTLFSKALLFELNKNGGGKQNLEANWQDIQNQLKTEDCAIEFVEYEKFGKQQMAALVLKKKGQPQFVTMPSRDSIMQFNCNGKTVSERIQYTHLNDGNTKRILNALYTDSTGVFRLIWNKELCEAIGKAKHIWFAPDGCFHRLAIEYMLPEEAAQYDCHRLTSTRILLSKRKKHISGKALLFGGIDYNASTNTSGTGNDTLAYMYFKKAHAKDNYPYPILKHSLTEAQTMMQQRAHPGDTLLSGGEATEQAFKQICSDYPIIHLCSHGEFHPTPASIGTDLKPIAFDNSMSESILAFAGINSNLKSDTLSSDALDGLLSAKEISSYNLTQAELVALSCCETGLGYITQDGVFGMQRGLKNAGAQAIIISLWEVNDIAGKLFMTQLYLELSRCQSLYDAFHRARKSVMDYYDPYKPAYYNVFILIDAI